MERLVRERGQPVSFSDSYFFANLHADQALDTFDQMARLNCHDAHFLHTPTSRVLNESPDVPTQMTLEARVLRGVPTPRFDRNSYDQHSASKGIRALPDANPVRQDNAEHVAKNGLRADFRLFKLYSNENPAFL